jgi:hypothetical protein
MIFRKRFRRGKGAPFGTEQQQLLRREGVYRNADTDAKQGSAGWNPNPSAYALVTASKRDFWSIVGVLTTAHLVARLGTI